MEISQILGIGLIALLWTYLEERNQRISLIKKLEKEAAAKKHIIVFQMEDFSETKNINDSELKYYLDYFANHNPFYEKVETSRLSDYYQFEHKSNKSNRVIIYER